MILLLLEIEWICNLHRLIWLFLRLSQDFARFLVIHRTSRRENFLHYIPIEGNHESIDDQLQREKNTMEHFNAL